MASIIIRENGATSKQVIQLKEKLEDMNLSVIGYWGASSTAQPDAETALAEDLIAQAKSGTSSHTLILSAHLASMDNLTDLIAAMESCNTAMSFADVSNGSCSSSMPLLGAADMPNAILSNSEWPFMAVAIRNDFLSTLNNIATNSAEGFFLQAIIAIVAECEIISSAGAAELNCSDEEFSAWSTVSESERANALRAMINLINIEDLFPSHAWELHSTESAAAGYHKLAAGFLSLKDSESALECLSLGDQLEDSPRSLALKGLIALNQGQTLAAVANMVSSLQEYEKRKKTDKVHYLTFKPNNLEVINSNLQSGLDALNKRENDRALEYFTDAVFGFDNFFEDFGLDQIKSQLH